ncbi:hypothetical protein [Haloplanus pelagicus]|uniref:hypothetical protein n=1 Tax=Haloplanus pelagicus TaxID=2949995 RepID=UPI0020426463|nr:hypothetical protein [Haloplanus sp. HW8-1]
MVERIGSRSTPAALKDVARTFGESDVTVSTDATRVANGSVELVDTSTSTVSRPADGTSTTSSTGKGVVVVPSSDLSSIEVTVSSNVSGGEGVRVTDSDANTLDSVSGSYNGNETVTLNASLSAESKYYVAVDGPDGWEAGTNENVSYPYESKWLDMVSGVDTVESWDGGSEDDTVAYSIESITATNDSVTSGSVTVEFGTPGTPPPDAVGWDVAYMTRTLNGETVEIYVQEAQGSPGWTDVAGPIRRGDSIPADPENDVRFRVKFSRSDTSSNPTLDSILRRYKL